MMLEFLQPSKIMEKIISFVYSSTRKWRMKARRRVWLIFFFPYHFMCDAIQIAEKYEFLKQLEITGKIINLTRFCSSKFALIKE